MWNAGEWGALGSARRRREDNIKLNSHSQEISKSAVLPTVIDVLQVRVLLDVEADSPAVQQHHEDGDVLWTRAKNELPLYEINS